MKTSSDLNFPERVGYGEAFKRSSEQNKTHPPDTNMRIPLNSTEYYSRDLVGASASPRIVAMQLCHSAE